MSAHTFDLLMVGVCGGFLLFVILDWVIEWYYKRKHKQKDTPPQDYDENYMIRGGDSFYKQMGYNIVIEKPTKEQSLADQLKKAIDNEDYEKAAKIRDKINKFK